MKHQVTFSFTVYLSTEHKKSSSGKVKGVHVNLVNINTKMIFSYLGHDYSFTVLIN